MSKLYTSLAALALVEQGRLDLDDPVAKWLPYFTPPGPDGEAAAITVRHLLCHAAGLNYGFFQPVGGAYDQAGVSDGLDDSGLTLEENLRRLATVPLLFEPGAGWHYSLATDVLGAVVAAAHGKPLPEATRELVTAPLGLWDTGYAVVDKARLSAAYLNGEDGAFRMAERQVLPAGDGEIRFAPGRALDADAYPSGGAGMVGTAPDYLRVLETLRRGGAAWFGQRVTLDNLNADPVGVGEVGPGVGYALGWSVTVDPAAGDWPYAAGTMAWSGVYGGCWLVDPARGVSILLITNTSPEGMDSPTTLAFRRAVYDHLPSMR